MILSMRDGYIFICNGRTGSRSYADAFRTDETSEFDFGDSQEFFVGKHLPPCEIPSWELSNTLITTMRDPESWVLSQWRHNFAPEPNQKMHESDVIELARKLKRFRGVEKFPTLFQSTYLFVNEDRRVEFIIDVNDPQNCLNALEIMFARRFTVEHSYRSESAGHSMTKKARTLAGMIWYIDFQNYAALQRNDALLNPFLGLDHEPD